MNPMCTLYVPDVQWFTYVFPLPSWSCLSKWSTQRIQLLSVIPPKTFDRNRVAHHHWLRPVRNKMMGPMKIIIRQDIHIFKCAGWWLLLSSSSHVNHTHRRIVEAKQTPNKLGCRRSGYLLCCICIIWSINRKTMRMALLVVETIIPTPSLFSNSIERCQFLELGRGRSEDNLCAQCRLHTIRLINAFEDDTKHKNSHTGRHKGSAESTCQRYGNTNTHTLTHLLHAHFEDVRLRHLMYAVLRETKSI